MAISEEYARARRKRLHDFDAARKEGGFFSARTREVERACEEVLADPADREKIADDLRTAAKLIRRAKTEIAKGNADDAARWAFEAGMYWQNARLVFLHDDDVRFAEKAEADRERGREERERHDAALRRKRFAFMRKWEPEVGVEEAVRRCAKIKGMGTTAAIKRQWNRHKEKRDS